MQVGVGVKKTRAGGKNISAGIMVGRVGLGIAVGVVVGSAEVFPPHADRKRHR
jgi:hypothetical protein